MNEVEVLTNQTENTYQWTNKLIASVPFEMWEIIPEVVASNITWQVGHLLMSHYFHSIIVIKGHQMDILNKIPVKDYGNYFTEAPAVESIGKTTPEVLFSQLKLKQQKSIEIISSLSVYELESQLEPSPIPHPIAKSKFEAIDWNNMHTMYHCGQIGMIKRIVDQRYDFGLRRPK